MEEKPFIKDIAWYVSRDCYNCGCELTIYADNLHYHRNKWTLGIKKEFYTKCACDNKIYVDKKHIKESIQRYVRTNKDVTQSASAINWKNNHVKNEYECTCDNCKRLTMVSYDNIKENSDGILIDAKCFYCDSNKFTIKLNKEEDRKFLQKNTKMTIGDICSTVILGAILVIFSPLMLPLGFCIEWCPKDQLE